VTASPSLVAHSHSNSESDRRAAAGCHWHSLRLSRLQPEAASGHWPVNFKLKIDSRPGAFTMAHLNTQASVVQAVNMAGTTQLAGSCRHHATVITPRRS